MALFGLLMWFVFIFSLGWSALPAVLSTRQQSRGHWNLPSTDPASKPLSLHLASSTWILREGTPALPTRSPNICGPGCKAGRMYVHQCLSVWSRPGWQVATVGQWEQLMTPTPGALVFASASFGVTPLGIFLIRRGSWEAGPWWWGLGDTHLFKAKGTQTFFSQRSHLGV